MKAKLALMSSNPPSAGIPTLVKVELITSRVVDVKLLGAWTEGVRRDM
jgi:hypothetical protein